MACNFSPEHAPAAGRDEHYNFAAGPAMLPPALLAQIQDELPDWRGSGLSLLEHSFTGAPFKQLMQEVEQDLRELLTIPSNYHVLFMHGGACCQFGLLPMNLLAPGQSADYLESGYWAAKAIAEARRHAPVNIVASGQRDSFTALPEPSEWRLDPRAGYCHITSNETANGLQLQHFPELSVPLVADMSSDLLTRPLPLERFGLIYASAQKNLGIAGLCLLIVRDDLLKAPRAGLPSPFSYALQAEQQSRLCTPPSFALYCAALMLRWIRQQGGLAAMASASRRKSEKLYRCIDASDLYQCPQRPSDRSAINVCFQLRDNRLLTSFLQQAAQAGLLNLPGHAAIGGIRVSLYNAMPQAGVDRLVAFMHRFECRHG
ncbi:3-phosphoserine/phosphohydroxythreonine transaminase [Pseudomonas sp. sp1636]|uniref:3-phosphoserine/phosphohydroxythreonine transaminase n=1 Tax=Pseudomonas sp. sp1636 TaxID=3036707 RepID=UPI0025A4EE6A|nr:3-phosphoserine/phosphohydroxythreonine transaminase [Pseudomonas sp. sp1636]MDM8350576.1 3-phosphoserine/phosphohydroxythreonine transaminase [Pseudomonas sp. sp1636]